MRPLGYLSHFALVLLPVMHFAFARAQVEQARPYGVEVPGVGAALGSILISDQSQVIVLASSGKSPGRYIRLYLMIMEENGGPEIFVLQSRRRTKTNSISGMPTR